MRSDIAAEQDASFCFITTGVTRITVPKAPLPPFLRDGDQGDQALGREENQFFETSDFPQMLGSRLRRHPAVFVFEK